ncbi:MAG TPA: glucose 1-dehydrogenase [Chitinophagaceae bacterium]|nr:glucose 1-dehydrogenase [Chitinophagaceae bacterium]
MEQHRPFTLTGKKALVTGGGKGLGFAISRALLNVCAEVVIIGRNESLLKSACLELGEKSSYIVFDLSQTDKIPDLVFRLEQDFGPFDILVNNAGINQKKDFLQVSDAEFGDIITINLHSVFSLTREFSKKMVTRGRGCIIMISSMASQYGIPKVIAYTASKSAVEGMTRALAVELSPLGVRVNCIAPGFIATAMSARALNDDKERMRQVLERTPMGKLGHPDDIGHAAVYLASEEAGFVTGIVLPVDGGNSIGF